MQARRDFLRNLALVGAIGGSSELLFANPKSVPNTGMHQYEAFDEGMVDSTNIVSVVEAGIKNDGSPIGVELNNLVKRSYLKTLFFPAGTYNLSEPIVLPFDYTKNVNIIFDKNALIKTDIQMEGLLKIGYSEMSTPDVTQRRFSYIEGGQFDCSNVENGIMVNGLKQLVSLKYITLFKGRKTHILISVTDDFKGTGSSDTKIDNITIQGDSSNDEVYGIYIDNSCHDCKISNTFIYGTKYAILTKSAGHFINNVHILSWIVKDGTRLSEGQQFPGSEGVRFESGGFFILHEVYFDTVDKSIVITEDNAPRLIVDKCVFYSYLEDFGTAFVSKDYSSLTPFQIKISNSIIEVRNNGYKIFDINPKLISEDVDGDFSLVNYVRLSTNRLSPYDVSLAQRVRGVRSDVLHKSGVSLMKSQWFVLGAVIASQLPNKIRIDLDYDSSLIIDMLFDRDQTPRVKVKKIMEAKSRSYQIGYVVNDDYCILCINILQGDVNPIINDLLGCSSFMSTPSKDRVYNLSDYGIHEESILLVND